MLCVRYDANSVQETGGPRCVTGPYGVRKLCTNRSAVLPLKQAQ